jgi:hypothetical protein
MPIHIHEHMRTMGYRIHTVYAATPAAAWAQVRPLLINFGGP